MRPKSLHTEKKKSCLAFIGLFRFPHLGKKSFECGVNEIEQYIDKKRKCGKNWRMHKLSDYSFFLGKYFLLIAIATTRHILRFLLLVSTAKIPTQTFTFFS